MYTNKLFLNQKIDEREYFWGYICYKKQTNKNGWPQESYNALTKVGGIYQE